MKIHPRSLIGTPEPPSTRPKLQRVKVLLAHHVGFSNTSRYRSADPIKVLDDARAAARFGISSGRAWEYSYMIGLNGWIFEQGGQYRASHCLNFNGESAGVLFLNADGDVACTPAQIEAWHWLRSEMSSDRLRILTVDHTVAPHYRYRGTECPGLARAEAPGKTWASPTGQGRLGELIPALRFAAVAPQPEPQPLPPPTPTDPTPEEIAPMLFIAKPTFAGARDDYPWLVYYENPGDMPRAERATNAHVKAAVILKVPVVDQDSEDQYRDACAKYGVKVPA